LSELIINRFCSFNLTYVGRSVGVRNHDRHRSSKPSLAQRGWRGIKAQKFEFLLLNIAS
jgi:hypothetical protein